jgi:hypothetical protein
MSGGNGLDSTLECVVPGVCGFLLLHPIVVVLKTNATRGSKWVMLIRNGELLGMQRPGSPSQVAG